MKIIEIEEAVPRLYQDQVELEATSDGIPWFFHERERACERGIRDEILRFQPPRYQ